MRDDISIMTRFDEHGGRYIIFEGSDICHPKVLWSYPVGKDDEDPYPLVVRQKYEELLGRPEFVPFDEGQAETGTSDLGELFAYDEDDSAFDQPCRYGHRCGTHAVYCHNDGWLYAPRKCRRTWYTGGDVRDEDCRGFKPNPRIVGTASETKEPIP